MIDQKTSPSGICKLHHVRFYNLNPRAIQSSAYNRDLKLLALSREDASIEIWNVHNAPYLQQTIAGSTESSVEAICWAGNRLFSTGLTGELIEWDLLTLTEKRKLLLTGNSAWCLDVNKQKTQLVVGTEGGYVNVFDVSDPDEVNFDRIFDRQEGRILCCKFDHSGEFVVTGSEDTIRIWQLSSGHALYKMSTGRLEAKKETIVWSLAVLSDFSIIAGDSRGYITIWDGKLGAQIDSIAAMKCGDVLAIAVSADEKTFACAGIEPNIKIFARSEIKKGETVHHQWVRFIRRAVHEHDVKTLQFVDDTKLFSGGIDGYLAQSFASKAKESGAISKFGPFLGQSCAEASPEKRVLLLKYLNYVELWKLGVPSENVQISENADAQKKFYSLEEGPQKLLELKAKDGESIVCSTISPNGQYLVYSTSETIRFFCLQYDENKISTLSKVKVLSEQFSPSLKCIFSSDSSTIYLLKNDRSIDVFQIVETEQSVDLDFVETIRLSKHMKGFVAHVIISNCGEYLVCSDLCSNVSAWKRTKKSWKHHIKLPKYPLPPVALAIHRNSPKLVVAFADTKLFEYHLEDMEFVASSHCQFVENQKNFAIKNIILDANNENIIILHNDQYLFVLEKKIETNKSDDAKKKKKSKGNASLQMDSDDDVAELVCVKKASLEHLVNVCWLNDSELIAVNVNPVALLAQLPSPLKQKLYGVS